MARADDAAEVDVATVFADAVDGARVDGGGDAAPEDQCVARAARLPAAVRPDSRHLRIVLVTCPLKSTEKRLRGFIFRLTLHLYLVLITLSDGQLSSSGDKAAASASSCCTSMPLITYDSDRKIIH